MKFEIATSGVKRRLDVTGASPEQMARVEASLKPFVQYFQIFNDGTGRTMVRPRDVCEVRGILEVIANPPIKAAANVVAFGPRPVERCFCRGCGETSPARFTTLPLSLIHI